MLHALLTCLLLLFASFGVVSAQIIDIDPETFTTTFDESRGLCYNGDETFMEVRSCRIEWFNVEFTSIRFDASTKLLTIEGQITSAHRSKKPISEAQVLLGGPIRRDSAAHWSRAYCMEIRERYEEVDESGRFRLSIGPIHPGDRIAFVPRVSPQDGSILTAWSKVFAVGHLAMSAQTHGEGPSLGQR